MKRLFYLQLIILLFWGCKPDPVDAPDPGSNDPNDLMKVLVGVKSQYAVGQNSALYNAMTISGLITKEVVTKTGGILDLNQLQSGGRNLLPTNNCVTRLWTALMTINGSSMRAMNSSRNLGDRDMARSIYAFGGMYRALALGTAAAFWDSLPLATGSNMIFYSRRQALLLATRTLDSAYDSLTTARVPDLFFEKVGREIDLKNTILILSARYYNMLKMSDSAIKKAMMSEIGQGSVYLYNKENFNPVYYYAINSTVGYRPNIEFGLPAVFKPDPTDKRRLFYLSNGGRTGFFATSATTIPIFLQGEKLLILAEAYLLKGDAINAKKYLDELLVKDPSNDIFGVGADISPLAPGVSIEELEKQIFKNRSIELFMSGLRLEDARRFIIDTSVDKRTRNFLPYPQVERDGNINTPPDPSF